MSKSRRKKKQQIMFYFIIFVIAHQTHKQTKNLSNIDRSTQKNKTIKNSKFA